MSAFPSRNALATKLFIEDALKYCDGGLPSSLIVLHGSIIERCP
jgi:transposase-like protein